MSQTARRWVIASVVVALLLAAAGWWLSGHLKKRVVEAGLTEQALANPWLATDKLLQQWGRPIEVEDGLQLIQHESRLQQLHSTLLLTHVYAQLTPAETGNLLHWVKQGGQLIVAVDNPFVGVDETLKTPLMDVLGVSVYKSPDERASLLQTILMSCYSGADIPAVSIGQDKVEFAAHSNRLLKQVDTKQGIRLRLEGKDKQGIRLLQFAVGQGSVTLLPSATIWHNRHLGCHNHAYLLWTLVGPTDGLMVVDNKEPPSLWGTLWQHGWLVLIITALGILLWLWRAGRRFGPVHHQLPEDEPDLQQHLQASGWFLWRHHAEQPLIDAVRQQVIDLASQRVQGFRRAGRQERLRLLAERTPHNKTHLRHLLYQQPIERKNFVSLISELQQLKDQI